MKAQRGEQMYSSTLPSTSTLDGGWVVNATPRPLYPLERPGTLYIGGWEGPRAGLDVCWKSRPPPGFDPRTLLPVASPNTDYGNSLRTEISFDNTTQLFSFCWSASQMGGNDHYISWLNWLISVTRLANTFHAFPSRPTMRLNAVVMGSRL